jgi:hypothetical protein
MSGSTPEARPSFTAGASTEASPRASLQQHLESGCQDPQEADYHTLREKILLLFTSPDICIFFAMATMFGFAAGNIDGFLFLYLEDLGAPKVMMGLTITVGELSVERTDLKVGLPRILLQPLPAFRSRSLTICLPMLCMWLQRVWSSCRSFTSWAQY